MQKKPNIKQNPTQTNKKVDHDLHDLQLYVNLI